MQLKETETVCVLKLNLVTLVCSHKLQALRHRKAGARAIIEISRLPLDCDEVFQFFHRLGVMRVDATLEVIPQILNGIEIRTPWWEIDHVHSMVVEPGTRCAGIVRRRIVLLIPPLAARPEGMS